jgi:TetR/AcrR family tetracycline transcriptional repressor
MVFVSSPDPDAALPIPPWSSRRRRPARDRTPLSRDAIVDAAMAILDAEGLDALTMRRVATALGTGPASLYAHVTGKDELLELLIDRVAAEQEVPDPDPEHWQEQVKDGIRGIYRSFLAHPGLARANLGRIPTGPGALHTIDRFLGILRAGGLPDQVVAFAADLLPLYATAYAFEQSIFAERMSQEGERYMAELDAYWKSLPAARFPNIAALSGELMAEPDPDARFEFGLDALVTGIAAMGRR